MKESPDAGLYVTLSNSYALLLDRIEQEFAQSKKDLSARRLIVVQDRYIQAMVQLELSKRLGVLFAVDVIPLEQVVAKFLETDSLQYSLLTLLQKEESELVCAKAQLTFWYGLETENHFAEKVKEKVLKIDEEMSNIRYDAIYLFGISSLCPRLHNMFLRLSKEAHVSLYVLSFCMMFWTDIYSDNQLKKLKTIDDALYDRSSILANCGMLQKAYAKLLDYTVEEIHEAYVLADWAQNVRPDVIVKKDISKKTLLKGVQNDILLLERPKSEQKNQNSPIPESSIQIHAVPTLEREVAVCIDSLARIVAEIDTPLNPADILILAPCIETYRPYIERMNRCGLPIQIFAVKPLDATGLIRVLFHLFFLAHSRYGISDIEQLLSCKAFMKKCHLDAEDVSSIKMALKKLEFRWAMNQEHKKGFLDCVEGADAQTFEDFQKHFIEMWAQDMEESICVQEAESIASFISVFVLLFQDLSKHDVQSLLEWVAFMDMLVEKYFFIDEEEAYEYELFLQAQNKLIKCSEQSDAEICFSTFERLFKQALDEAEQNFDTIAKAPIVAASLGSFRGYPAKVICLLGMQEEAFPRQGVKRLVQMGASLMPGSSFMHASSMQALDKSLFLEALTSARDALFISYQSYSFEDHNLLYPSGCIQDLLSDYAITVKEHSIDACTEVEAPKMPAKSFFVQIQKTTHTEKRHVEVSYLMQVARSPLKPYFQKNAKLSFYEAKPDRFEDEFSLISNKTFQSIVKSAFFKGKDEQKIYVEQKLAPLSLALKRACEHNIFKELEVVEKNAAELGCTSKTLWILEFNPTTDAPYEKSSSHFVFPSIKFDSMELVGTLDGVCKEGIFHFANRSTEDVVKLWPKILLLASLKERHSFEILADVLFLKNPERISFAFDDLQNKLERFVRYALMCEDEPYCLYPELLQTILTSKTAPNPLIHIDERFYRDPYLTFFAQEATASDIASYWSVWHEMAHTLSIKEYIL